MSKDRIVVLTLTRENRVQQEKNATVAKEKNFGSGIGMTRPKQAGWRKKEKNSGGKRDLETLFYTLVKLTMSSGFGLFICPGMLFYICCT